MYLILLLKNQMIDNYLKVEKLRLCHRSIGNEISRHRRKRVKLWLKKHSNFLKPLEMVLFFGSDKWYS